MFHCQGVVKLACRRMNFIMFPEIVIDDFLKDGLNDLRVGVLKGDHNDAAALFSRLRLQIVSDNAGGAERSCRGPGFGKDICRADVGDGLLGQIHAGKNLNFGIDDVVPARIGHDHLLVSPPRSIA